MNEHNVLFVACSSYTVSQLEGGARAQPLPVQILCPTGSPWYLTKKNLYILLTSFFSLQIQGTAMSTKMAPPSYNNNLGDNHPYSQLELNCEIQHVREAGMQGRIQLQTIMTTAHSQYRKCLIIPEGGKPDGLDNPRGTAENQRTTQLTYSPGRESNRCNLGVGRALYAHADRATQYANLFMSQSDLWRTYFSPPSPTTHILRYGDLLMTHVYMYAKINTIREVV